jgi:hypothetical protein
MNTREKTLCEFLKSCNIISNDTQYTNLEGITVYRNTLVNNELYFSDNIQNQIKLLKTIFSSSSLTCLQIDADKKQKWPLLNLVRQILNAIDYKIVPGRKSNGYTVDGKKKMIRFFTIKKNKKVSEVKN